MTFWFNKNFVILFKQQMWSSGQLKCQVELKPSAHNWSVFIGSCLGETCKHY